MIRWRRDARFQGKDAIARNMNPSGGDWTANQSFTDESVYGDHKPSNGRNTKRQSRRREKSLDKGDECGRRTLV